MLNRLILRAMVTTTLAISTVVAAAVPASAKPDPSPGLPPGLDGKLNTLLGMLMALVTFACVAGFLIVAGKMALAFRRGEGGESAGQLGLVAAACILVGSASTIAFFLM